MLFDRLRAGFRHSALVATLVIWGFGYVLVDLIAALLGRTPPGLMLLASIPMFMLGVGQTLALNWVRGEMQHRPLAARWAWLLLGVALATAIQSLFDLYWLRFLALNAFPAWQEWALGIPLQRLLTTAIIYLWTFCLALTLLWATRLSGTAEASAARAATAEAAAAKAMAAALRLQLNPHFLFNTLNSISSLVTLGRQQEAEHMIDRLADFLRASLNADPMEDVPLAQEIETVEAYLDIEAARFGDRLAISIDIAADLDDAPVPNFILQPLVENAIKHGVSAVKGPATLGIAAVRENGHLLLSVTNSAAAGAEADAGAVRPGTGIGLANCRQRLANRYGEEASLETERLPGGYRAAVRLPLDRCS